MSLAIFYGSSNGMTEDVAQKIAAELEKLDIDVPLMDVFQVKLADMQAYDKLLIGCPTWYIGELQDDWDEHFGELDDIDFSGKQVALFGTGDQIGYSDTFQDALGIIGKKCREQGAEIVGWWPTDGYTFDESVGVENGLFFGLALDDDNQPELTDERVKTWVAQLIREFKLDLVAG
ncbi:MAG: flavodoxin FldA [Deinococcota bacterium]